VTIVPCRHGSNSGCGNISGNRTSEAAGAALYRLGAISELNLGLDLEAPLDHGQDQGEIADRSHFCDYDNTETEIKGVSFRHMIKTGSIAETSPAAKTGTVATAATEFDDVDLVANVHDAIRIMGLKATPPAASSATSDTLTDEPFKRSIAASSNITFVSASSFSSTSAASAAASVSASASVSFATTNESRKKDSSKIGKKKITFALDVADNQVDAVLSTNSSEHGNRSTTSNNSSSDNDCHGSISDRTILSQSDTLKSIYICGNDQSHITSHDHIAAKDVFANSHHSVVYVHVKVRRSNVVAATNHTPSIDSPNRKRANHDGHTSSDSHYRTALTHSHTQTHGNAHSSVHSHASGHSHSEERSHHGGNHAGELPPEHHNNSQRENLNSSSNSHSQMENHSHSHISVSRLPSEILGTGLGLSAVQRMCKEALSQSLLHSVQT